MAILLQHFLRVSLCYQLDWKEDGEEDVTENFTVFFPMLNKKEVTPSYIRTEQIFM